MLNVRPPQLNHATFNRLSSGWTEGNYVQVFVFDTLHKILQKDSKIQL